MNLKLKIYSILVLAFLSCKNENKPPEHASDSIEDQIIPQPEFKNKGHELVYNMVNKTGTYSTFLKKEDVVYTYTYKTPDGKTDISTEKYIFNGELSYGAYKTHERTLPNLKGLIEQGFNGKNYWLKNNGTLVNDQEALKRVIFNRPTNFYWFAMMPKLLDPGLKYEYIGEQTLNSTPYDIVKISFETTDDKPKDIYQVYINKKSGLIDQFLFTVAEFGRTEPLLMVVEYENIDGILLPTKRKYKGSNWDAEVTTAPWIYVNWTDIKFNNHLTKAMFNSN